MNHELMQVSYTKVGQDKRGAKRLWLEGLRLDRAGFSAGARYRVVFDMDARSIALELSEDGDRVVSGRKHATRDAITPILDLASSTVTDIVGEAGSVRALMTAGRIVFTIHPRDVAKAEREARTRANIAAGTLTTGGLCSGGGIASYAVELGLEQAGFATRLAWIVDRERKYHEVAIANNPAVTTETVIFEASLEEVEPTLVTRVDVAQMSLPCTGHSSAGKSKRGITIAEDHPTDALAVYGALRLLQAANPCVVVSENVKAAATSATYAIVRAFLIESGYRIYERVLNEVDAGTLEARDRWWFLAISEGMADGFDIETLMPQPRQYACLAEALEDVPQDDPQWRRHDYLDQKEIRDRAAGKGFARQIVTPASKQVGTIGKSYQKRRSTEPFLRRADGLERLLTPIEHARVKGIPEFMVHGVSAQTAHEVLGQSILLPHAVALGAAVASHLAGNRVTTALRLPANHQPVQASLGF